MREEAADYCRVWVRGQRRLQGAEASHGEHFHLLHVPNTSPKLGWCQASGARLSLGLSVGRPLVAGVAVAVASMLAGMEPAKLDFGAGECHHLKHISNQEMP